MSGFIGRILGLDPKPVVDQIEALADGRFHLSIKPGEMDESIERALRKLTHVLEDTLQQANTIANGDYTANIRPRSDKDELGIALQKMTETLQGAALVVEAVSDGDLDVRLDVKGKGDLLASSLNKMIETLKDAAQQANTIANGDYTANIRPRSDKDELGIALQKMTGTLRGNQRRNEEQEWLQSGLRQMNEIVLGKEDTRQLAAEVISGVASYLGAQVGALYVMEGGTGNGVLKMLGSYAYVQRKNLSNQFHLGEGLVGQAALEQKQILLRNIPDDYVRVVSGLGEMVPRYICVTPLLYEGRTQGVLEIGMFEALDELKMAYLEQISGVIATAFEVTQSRSRLRAQQTELAAANEELYEQTRNLELSQKELEAQQQELEATNTELEMQMRRLKESEERLRVQRQELKVTNDELSAKNTLLERQKADIERTRQELARQAEEVARADKLKSEFLANMSHELRTPLNSLLLLARSLRDNSEGNMNEDQLEAAKIIFDSGSDLLNLINEILDLSKIEAGRMELRLEQVEVKELARTIHSQFAHVASSRSLSLEVHCEPGVPALITTDPQRLGQVIKNLVGNALKFTEEGGVTVSFSRPTSGAPLAASGLDVHQTVAVHVKDTGLGIPADKQGEIFEAFQQADSGDQRRFGGTGLGLTISRQLVELLGGEICLESQIGVGSTFSVFIPLKVSSERREPDRPGRRPVQPVAEVVVEDDRGTITDADRVVLIIEDDPSFLKILRGHVQQQGFKSLIAMTGERGLELARRYRPLGIVLDINLPTMDGWGVLSSLKQDTTTRHIPVHIVSVEPSSPTGMRLGAIGHTTKPITREGIETVIQSLDQASSKQDKLVLVVEDDAMIRREICQIVGNGNVRVHEVSSGEAALTALKHGDYDLVILDLGLPDIQGLAVLETLSSEGVALPPVIINTVRELTVEEETALRHYSDSIILKDVRSQERLVDEVALFLHRVVQDLPEDKRRIIRYLHESDEPLMGKRVLVVEDDMRTLFAMTRLLAEHGLTPIQANNGEKALAILNEQDAVDLVLLDMMMPVLDGYETARQIRAQARFAKLPIIALTAKAMMEDRVRCIDAGASDYMTKPVDPVRLISLMRVWLCR